MMRHAFLVSSLAVSLALFGGCQREQPPEQPQPMYSYAAASQTVDPNAQPAPTATSTAVQAFGPPCQLLEGTCGWARCDMATGRCNMLCTTNDQCVASAQCVGLPGLMTCLPKSAAPTP